MNLDITSLWLDLCALLRERGELPLRYDTLTPAEIASYLHSNGDERIQRFVWQYYYPRYYGQQPGGMTDEAALALVASFKKHASPEQPVEKSHASEASQPCAICNRRPAQGGGGYVY